MQGRSVGTRRYILMGDYGWRKVDERFSRRSCPWGNRSRRWRRFVASTTESLKKVTEFTKGINLPLRASFRFRIRSGGEHWLG
jgi:hypothetical protein